MHTHHPVSVLVTEGDLGKYLRTGGAEEAEALCHRHSKRRPRDGEAALSPLAACCRLPSHCLRLAPWCPGSSPPRDELQRLLAKTQLIQTLSRKVDAAEQRLSKQMASAAKVTKELETTRQARRNDQATLSRLQEKVKLSNADLNALGSTVKELRKMVAAGVGIGFGLATFLKVRGSMKRALRPPRRIQPIVPQPPERERNSISHTPFVQARHSRASFARRRNRSGVLSSSCSPTPPYPGRSSSPV